MREKIMKLLCRVKEDVNFADSTDFIGDGLIDSFEIVDLVGEIENAFSIEISGKDILPENFMNIEAMEVLIQKYTEGK